MSGGSARWLLIGNSRWHWALSRPAGLELQHESPPDGPAPPVHAWAAVGAVPATAALPPDRRLLIADVPLRQAPAWLGIDRALAGWQAWRECGGAVLVADAGTVLSLTWVDAQGGFAGGRLMAGLALQRRAMAAGTEALPSLTAAAPADPGAAEPWPRTTEAAMREGTRRGLAAAVAAAARELSLRQPGLSLVLTGGDGSELLELIRADLRHHDRAVVLRPALCLEGLMALRPLRPGPNR